MRIRQRRAGLRRLLYKFEALDFARWAFGKVFDEMDSRRGLKESQPSLAEVEQFCFAHIHFGPGCYECNQVLAQVIIRDSQSSGFQHCRMGFEHIINLPGSDVDPALDDQLLGPADDEEISIVFPICQVAGVKPASRRRAPRPCPGSL